ncbi:peptide ABC transporter substrate-binding protein [Stella sp.]|uniref:peptide ABC transporter substrate-binding protein n=1 Tax=Stella sp. TaxID=2912054 RepID=UPI0035ADDFAA
MTRRSDGPSKAPPGLILPRRRFLQLAAAGAAAGAFPGGVAWAQGARPPKGVRKGQVTVGISQEPTVFNPLRARIEVDEGVHMNLFSPLWSIDPKGNLVPELAVEIPTVENGGVSADGLNWRIKLRPGVTWHDGKPFTAEDVKYTLDLINDPNFPAMLRSGHNQLRDIKVVSPTEITWRMETFFAPYFSVLAWTYIVPKHILGAGGDPKDSPFNNKPVGTGPFKWVDRRPGDHILLEANDKFYGEGPFIEKLIFKYIPDLTVLKTQFQTGAIDHIGLQGITADNFAEAKGYAGRKVQAAPLPFVEAIVLNNERPYFKDAAVRQAMYLAMDKNTIIKDLFYGVPRPTESFLPQESWGYNPGLPVHKYDPAQAKKLLDDAGWKPGAGGVREKNGVKLDFTTSTTAGNHLREQTQQFLQQGWQQIGIKVTIKNFPPAVMWGDYWRKGQFDTAMAGSVYSVGSDPDPSERLSSGSISAKTGTGQNTSQYSNPQVDALLAASQKEVDRDKRKANYHKVQELVRADLPILPIYQWSMIEGVKSGLVGYQPNVNYRSNCWNINTWYWAS